MIKLESKFINNQMSEVQLEFEIKGKDQPARTQIPQEMDKMESSRNDISLILDKKTIYSVDSRVQLNLQT